MASDGATMGGTAMNWMRNVWYVAGFAHELDGVPWVARRFLGVSVVMLKTSGGEVSALEDVCPHRLLPLSAGRRHGDELQCGYHGLRFAADGTCLEAPGQAAPPARAQVRRLPLVARHGLLWIWLGPPTLARPELIPDMRWNDDPQWTPSRGYHHVQADYRLCMDNLMDLGHESWVHRRTIGQGDEECIPRYPVTVSVAGEGLVRAHREMPNIEPPPFFAMVLDHQGRINRWQTAIAMAPSLCMTDFGVYPVQASPDDAFRSHVLHLLTPETEQTTHYFWAVARNRKLDDAGLTEAMRAATEHTFDEDAAVLSLQQQQLQRYGGAVPGVALRVDEAPIRTRRALEALIRREAQEPEFCFVPPPMVDDATPALAMAA
jgi:vanillate O-demethylase monooxygenase subunit